MDNGSALPPVVQKKKLQYSGHECHGIVDVRCARPIVSESQLSVVMFHPVFMASSKKLKPNFAEKLDLEHTSM